MPLPFILAGAAAIAGGYGVKKGLKAKSDLEKAKSTNRKAQSIFDEAQQDLESARDETHNAMQALGETKFRVYQESMIPFAEAFSQIKNIDFKDSHISDGNLSVTDEQLKVMTTDALAMQEVVSGGIASLGAGGLAGLAAYGGVGLLGTTSTGTAIGTLSGAAATNATLAWLGGGSLAAGGFGMAGGMAVLGGLVAGPVLAVGGMMLASKAEAAKEDARANLHQAEIAAEEMQTAVVVTNSIRARFLETQNVLEALNQRFVPLLEDLQGLIASNQDYRSYSRQDQQGVYFCASLAKTIKNVLETPLLSDAGLITPESAAVLQIADKTVAVIDSGQGIDGLQKIEPPVVLPVEKETPQKQDLAGLFYKHRNYLNDESHVFYGMELARPKGAKKVDNAVQAYAHVNSQVNAEYKNNLLDSPIILVDTTTFGSGKSGFYITEREIVAKPSGGERFYIKYEDIRTIEIDEDDKCITINYEDLSYDYSSLTPRMKVIVDVIKKYISQ